MESKNYSFSVSKQYPEDIKLVEEIKELAKAERRTFSWYILQGLKELSKANDK